MSETIKNHPVRIAISTIIVVALFITGGTYKVANSKNIVENKILIAEKSITDLENKDKERKAELKELALLHKKEMEAIMEKCAENDIRYTAIQVELVGIKSLLEDIRDRR